MTKIIRQLYKSKNIHFVENVSKIHVHFSAFNNLNNGHVMGHCLGLIERPNRIKYTEFCVDIFNGFGVIQENQEGGKFCPPAGRGLRRTTFFIGVTVSQSDSKELAARSGMQS